jgi:type I restriction enzyme S subunit
VGKIAIAGCDMAMNQSCYALKPKMQGSDALIFHFLTLRLAVAYFKGMSNSGVFDNIVTDTFKIIPMMWPGEQLIKQFHVFAHPLVSKAARLIQINKHLTQSRNSLLGRLISGKATTDGLQVLLPPSQSAGDDPLTNATELAHA